jgi:hypothetical protein
MDTFLVKVRNGRAMTVQCRRASSPELEPSHLDLHVHCPTVQLAMHESLKNMCRNEELKSGETKTCLSPAESLNRGQALA